MNLKKIPRIGTAKDFFFFKKNLFLHKFLNEDFSRKHCISPSSACKTLKFQCSNSHIYSNFLSKQTRGGKKSPNMPCTKQKKPKIQSSKFHTYTQIFSSAKQGEKKNTNHALPWVPKQQKNSRFKTSVSSFLTFSHQPNRQGKPE